MSDKSALEIFNEMDILWNNFKESTWQMSVVPAKINLSTQQKNGK